MGRLIVWLPAIGMLWASPQAAQSTVRALVADRVTGKPLEGALVTLSLVSAQRAGADGRVTFVAVPPGDYTVSVVRIGYLPDTLPVAVDRDTVDLRLALAPRTVLPGDTTWVGFHFPRLDRIAQAMGLDLLSSGQDSSVGRIRIWSDWDANRSAGHVLDLTRSVRGITGFAARWGETPEIVGDQVWSRRFAVGCPESRVLERVTVCALEPHAGWEALSARLDGLEIQQVQDESHIVELEYCCLLHGLTLVIEFVDRGAYRRAHFYHGLVADSPESERARAILDVVLCLDPAEHPYPERCTPIR